ncbi:MAG: CoA-binding protein, partial [Nocardioidaceae bacterium]
MSTSTLPSPAPAAPSATPAVDNRQGGALRPVDALLRPNAIAIIGPSERHPALVRNLLRGGPPAVGVHPTRAAVEGLKCVPRISDLATVPDVAVVAVGHRHVDAVLHQLVDIGVRAVVLPGLGSEAAQEAGPVVGRVRALVEASGIAVLGHNCMGLATDGASAWIGSLPDTFLSGRVSVVSQSGSVAEAFTTLGPRVGFRSVVSTGSEMNRDAADFVADFAHDPGTAALGLFLESVRRPQAFLRALDLCARHDKPVVCLKVGRSQAAARVALAHTGALVGSSSAFSSVLRRFGVLEVSDVQEMVEVLELLGAPRRVRGTRLAAVSESGGECGLLADSAEAHGMVF